MFEAYVGYYSLAEMTLKLFEQNGRLLVDFPGVPPGFEVVLEPLETEHHFRMHGGPVDGTTSVFQLNEAGEVVGIVVGGEHELTRVDGPPPEPEYPTGQGLHPPELVLDGEKEAAFNALLDEMLTTRDGRLVAYDLPYPKHEYLQYVALQNKVIFHGSSNHEIEEFSIKRTSMEMQDKSGRGNVIGIYGTHDGLWPMFFAVTNRQKITGSIRNGFSTFRKEDGEEIRVYQFSINKDWLDKEPFHTGMIYFLPRETFKRMPVSVEGGESNEWVSEVPLKPLAKMIIEPADFPFLDEVGGHDDSELIALGEMGKQITAVTTEHKVEDERLVMKLEYSKEIGELLLAYIPMLQKFIPTAQITLRFEPEDGVYYEFVGPPAVMQVMVSRLEEKDES